MELIAIGRGYLKDLREWERDVSSIFCNYEYKDPKTSKKSKAVVRVAVRPIQLYEIVFPKKSLKAVLGMLKPSGNQDYIRDKSKKMQLLFKSLRKMLGLKELPVNWKEHKSPLTQVLKTHAVGLHLIGIREDQELKIGEAL